MGRTSMKRLSLALFALIPLACAPRIQGAPLPKAIVSSPCSKAPTIDGVLGADEWKEAPALKFDMPLIRFSPNGIETRPCELRVMNSANALYVALRVPDKTVDNSVSPLVADGAMLAFGSGPQIAPGDDRKAIAGPVYRDKHVKPAGKGEDDDAKQDGQGMLGRESGMCVFEWAVPLNSGDKQDLQAKPGDTIRFNLAYFDAFQIPITKTVIGSIHGAPLDRGDAWGTLQLASNVKDDGGSAFQGPSWVKPLFEGLKSSPASRLHFVDAPLTPGSTSSKALLSFTYRDEHGAEKEGKAKLYLPESVRTDPKAKRPLFFASGYEMADGMDQIYSRLGWIVSSPRELPTNPLLRTINPDSALLHMVRALPFVDDTRVIIGGGSAGGYMTLMQAAETFPLAGAIPDVPPVNWGYNAAYFYKQFDKAGPQQGSKDAKLPFLFAVATLLKGCQNVYGADYDEATWFAHSPLAHVPTITCPVSIYWSTADMLVPINQVGARWVQPFDATKFPEGFTMDPKSLMTSRDGRLTLLDVLPSSDYEVFTHKVPAGTSLVGAAGPHAVFELPMSADKLWSIGIVDEGAPEPNLGHRKYNLNLNRAGFIERAAAGKVPARQLTLVKLERLMDRYAGKEWLPTRLKHLDFPDSERADVLRGLRTYTAAGAENAGTFSALYGQLPAVKRVLEPEVVKELESGKSR